MSTTSWTLPTFLCAVSACASGPALDAPERLDRAERVADAIRELRGELAPLDLALPPKPSAARDAYLRHYRLEHPGVSHRMGTFEVDGLALTAQVFRPAAARSTVLVLHGYYDHVGVCSDLIRSLVEGGHAVFAFDLPGHGLSEGARATIEDFGAYSRALLATRELIGESLPRPVFFVGHSTGAAVALDLLLQERSWFERLVFVAPLVRSAYWGLSTTAQRLFGWMLPEELARRWPSVSSDGEYLLFHRWEDPLQYDRFPRPWFEALLSWEQGLREVEPVSARVLVIQGDEDDIVQWKHNLEFLQSSVPGTEAVLIEGGRHQLLNEGPELRARTLAEILAFLRPSPP